MNRNSDANKNNFKKEALMHLDSLLRAALYMTGDMDTANNLIQETYLRAYCLWGHSIVTTGYRTRLFRAMTGLLKEYEQARKIPMEPDSPDTIHNGTDDAGKLTMNIELDKVDELCDKLGGEAVKNAIGMLPYDLRLITVLSYIEGFSYQEIAEISETSIMRVKDKLSDGRQVLQEILWRQLVVEGLAKEHSAYS
jgi:RNA polymerase sigma-70 factor (ECF subfamily)